MTSNHPTKTIAEQAPVLGWYFERHSRYSEDWTPMTLLTPALTEAQLRQHYGPIRHVTELIALDEDCVDPAIRTKIDILGWRFESYSLQTETWTVVTELNTITEAQLCEAHDSIRNLTPIGRLSEVAAASYGEKTFDAETATTATSLERTNGHRE